MFKFDYSEDYVLEDDVVRLSPLKKSHIEPLLQISSEQSIWTYFFEKGDTYEALKAYIESAIKNRELNVEYPFVVYDKVTKRYAGTTRMYQYLLKTIKIGHTWYGEDFRGTGVNKRCKYLLFDFAFGKLGVRRIGFGVYEDNIISIKALQSLGCKKEGRLRDMFPSLDGKGRSDCILMSILKDEWDSYARDELLTKILVAR